MADQRRVLDAGAVDLCFVRLPVDADGLHLIRLYDEVPVVWASKDHPVAAFDDVATADLAGETVLDEVDPVSLGLVAQGDAVLRVPLSVARSYSRRDLVVRPVTDAPPTTVALAWRVDDDHDGIDEFIGIVRGRTPNSSRTAQERGAAPDADAKPKPAAKPKPGRTPARPSGGGRRTRRR